MNIHRRVSPKPLRGVLSVPCPKCLAPPGHRCRPLHRTPSSVPGDRKSKAHQERSAAARSTA